MKTIAVDIDDVLAAEAEFIIAYSNKRWGHTLSLEDYSEEWTKMWQLNRDEVERRATELHQPGIVSQYRLLEEAHEVLRRLASQFKLMIITSRRSIVKEETLEWLEKNFKDVFSEVHFSGIWEGNNTNAHLLTKTELCVDLGVAYLIDDQPKHCFGAAKAGIQAILFGNHPSIQDLKLPPRVVHCKNWQEVGAYFDGRD